MLEKPPHGQPCNACGQCCVDRLCPLAIIKFPKWNSPCPALESDGEKRICGLVNSPAKYNPTRVAIHGAKAVAAASAMLIGSGSGCDARLADEPIDITFRQRMIDYGRKNAAVIVRSKKIYGVT